MGQGQDDDTRYLWVDGDRSARHLLFAIGQGGTGASVWLEVQSPHSAEVALVAARLPGRENRLSEPPLRTVEDNARDVAATISDLARGRAVSFVGVCFGAVVAYECSRQLCHRGVHPEQLIVMDARFGPSDDLPAEAETLSEDEFSQYARDIGVWPDWVWEDPEFVAMLARQLRADIAAHTTYRWPASDAPVAGHLAVMTGSRVSAAEAKAWSPAGEHLTIAEGAADLGAQLLRSPAEFGAKLAALFGSARAPRSG